MQVSYILNLDQILPCQQKHKRVEGSDYRQVLKRVAAFFLTKRTQEAYHQTTNIWYVPKSAKHSAHPTHDTHILCFLLLNMHFLIYVVQNQNMVQQTKYMVFSSFKITLVVCSMNRKEKDKYDASSLIGFYHTLESKLRVLFL